MQACRGSDEAESKPNSTIDLPEPHSLSDISLLNQVWRIRMFISIPPPIPRIPPTQPPNHPLMKAFMLGSR